MSHFSVTKVLRKDIYRLQLCHPNSPGNQLNIDWKVEQTPLHIDVVGYFVIIEQLAMNTFRMCHFVERNKNKAVKHESNH